MNKRSSESFYTLWTLGIVLCVILSVFSLLFASCTSVPASVRAEREAAEIQEKEDKQAQKAAAKEARQAEKVGVEITPTPEPTPEPTAEPTPEPIPTELAESADQGAPYIEKFIFLGDSTTYGLAANDVLPFTQVWTPESGTLTLSNQAIAYVVNYNEDGTTQNMLIANAAALRKPEYLVITLGINGISFMSEEEFKEQYIDLIESVLAVSPDTKIICQSIYPVIDSSENVSADIGNSRINAANKWVYAIAEETGTRYLNTHDALMDDTGNLRSEYCNGDGIHLSAAGGEAVLMYIRTHVYK